MNLRRLLNPRALFTFSALTFFVMALYTRELGGQDQSTQSWLLQAVGLTAAVVITSVGLLAVVNLMGQGGLRVERAQRLGQQGQTGAALAQYNQMLGGADDKPAALVGRAELLIGEDKLMPALDDLTRAILATPHVSNFPDPILYRAYMERGRVRELLGDRNGALEDWGQALSVAPDQPEIYLLRGRVASEAGQYYQGQADLQQAIKLATRNLKGAGQQDRSVQAAMLNLRGLAYNLLGQAPRALPDLEAALALDSHAWAVHFNLAASYLALGHHDPALAALGEAVRLHPPAAAAARRSPAFRALRGDPLFEGLLDGVRRVA